MIPLQDTLTSIFYHPQKKRHAHIDDKSLSLNAKWNALANYFMNAEVFAPENVWVDKDSKISDMDPYLPLSPPWNGEQLQKRFYS
jgi:hypothetical protein